MLDNVIIRADRTFIAIDKSVSRKTGCRSIRRSRTWPWT